MEKVLLLYKLALLFNNYIATLNPIIITTKLAPYSTDFNVQNNY